MKKPVNGASSGSNYEPLASLDAESDEQSAGAEIGSSLTRHPDADVESEDALVYIDEEDGDAGAKIGSGGRSKNKALPDVTKSRIFEVSCHRWT